MQFLVLRHHQGDRFYAPGEIREALADEVAHLVRNGVLGEWGQSGLPDVLVDAPPPPPSDPPADRRNLENADPPADRTDDLAVKADAPAKNKALRAPRNKARAPVPGGGEP